METEVFCPFVNGECKENCIFYNDGGDYLEEMCDIHNAVDSLRMQNMNGTSDEVIKKLDVVQSAIPEDYSYGIKSTLDDIHREIQKINKENV